MTARRPLLLAAGAALTLVALSTLIGPRPLLVWNATASVPRGLYLALSPTPLAVGDTVTAWLPEPVRALAAERRYLPRNVPVMKTVRARAGSMICANETVVSIDGEAIPRLAADPNGRPLPSWTGCRTLGPDDVFLLSDTRPDSFDSRYFGAISTRQITAKVRPLWTY